MVAISDVVDGVQVAAPQAPAITFKDIGRQFWIDIAGKEVQIAESSSHSWVANQFGHVCLGILLASGAGILLAAFKVPFPWNSVVGCAIAAIGVIVWEFLAYRKAVKDAIGHQFPLGKELLLKNAIDAAAYMVLGVAIAFVYRFFSLASFEFLGLSSVVWGGILYVVIASVAVWRALFWLGQKITWQKAGLPFLFRLADAQPIQDAGDATNLQRVINRKPPPYADANQIVVGGPISSGRTEFCAGIGTEFAFRDARVRYLGLTTLLEFAARSKQPPFPDDQGPRNIQYWPWSTAQVVIIDDIWPLLTGNAQTANDLADQFQAVLELLNPIRQVLAGCHTIWVLGDAQRDGQLRQSTLDDFARLITEFCLSQPDKTLVIELEGVQGQAQRGPRVQRASYL